MSSTYPGRSIPATLTSRSKRSPCRSNRSATTRLRASSSVTSSSTTSALPPAASTSLRVLSAPATSTSPSATVAPAAAKVVDTARPSPLAAPVTSATRPVSSSVLICSLSSSVPGPLPGPATLAQVIVFCRAERPRAGQREVGGGPSLYSGVMFFSRAKTQPVTAEDALAGRQVPLYGVPAVHAVNGNRILPPFPEGMQTAVFGAGCFWGVEKVFWQTPGVYSTAAGYAGGYTPNPTYEEVCSARTGHTEAVLVVFDPAVISYEQLLKVFWEDHDPTQGMRQGNEDRKSVV